MLCKAECTWVGEARGGSAAVCGPRPIVPCAGEI